MSDVAELTYGDKKITLPVVHSVTGEPSVDIGKLRAQSGMTTLDNGFANTASCTSRITYVDGEKGILLYRGIPIEQLAEKSEFLEVAYLLLYGDLPSGDEYAEFKHHIGTHAMLHESAKLFFNGFRDTAHPMAVCSAVVGSLAAFYPNSLEVKNPRHVEITTHRLLAKMPTIAAYSYKKSRGQPFMYPSDNLDYATNFLHMMFSLPTGDYEVNPVAARALNMLLLLQADHEQNCSTSAVRLVGSSMSNLIASVSAGMYALWGPLHGGANQAVVQMLERIYEDDGNVDKYVEMAKDKDDDFRLMGFGHRVYKNFDPRAKILKKSCDEVLTAIGVTEPLLDIALKLEEIALRDEYFVERKLYPNVDFYSGIISKALGFPTSMFTVLFAMGRMPGWIAHWRELQEDPDARIGRPRQVYAGSPKRDYVSIDQR